MTDKGGMRKGKRLQSEGFKKTLSIVDNEWHILFLTWRKK